MFGKPKKPSAEDMMAELLRSTEATSDEATSDSKCNCQELEAKFDALWLLLQEKLQLSEQDLEACVDRLRAEKSPALEDQSSETPQGPQQCPKCGRTVSVTTGVCLYCGKE